MDIGAVIAHCAPTVEPATMERILRVESAFRIHAIGYRITKDGKVFRLAAQPTDQAQAVSWAQWLLSNGYRFDAGIAQINSANFSRFGLHAANVFDACSNIAAGGAILTEFYRDAARRLGAGQAALEASISAYQTGSPTLGYGTGYVARVIQGPLVDAGGLAVGDTEADRPWIDALVTPQQSATGVAFGEANLSPPD